VSTLLTLPAVAERLSISLSLVRKLARAAELAAEVRAGKRRLDDVPPALVRYLDSGFPAPKRIGSTIRRVRAEELERWLQ
jgi:predicted DNA-binding transcriptional regulator AlpA